MNRGKTLIWIQAAFSLTCITTAFFAIFLSTKLWQTQDISVESNYNDILKLREDRWLGIAREGHSLMNSLAGLSFVPVVGLAAIGRTRFHYVACAACGLILIVTGIAWEAVV